MPPTDETRVTLLCQSVCSLRAGGMHSILLWQIDYKHDFNYTRQNAMLT